MEQEENQYEYSGDGLIHDINRLKKLQALPLWRKIQITQARIIEWYQHYDGQVYISFSGGKDSTVLLDLARRIYPDIEGVFVDTGLEYSQIRDFVKTFDNITWLKPEMRFDEVIKTYGYPIITKEVSRDVGRVQKNSGWNSRTGERTMSWKLLHDEVFDKNGKPSIYNKGKWMFLCNAPFKISNDCCDIMKKNLFIIMINKQVKFQLLKKISDLKDGDVFIQSKSDRTGNYKLTMVGNPIVDKSNTAILFCTRPNYFIYQGEHCVYGYTNGGYEAFDPGQIVEVINNLVEIGKEKRDELYRKEDKNMSINKNIKCDLCGHQFKTYGVVEKHYHEYDECEETRFYPVPEENARLVRNYICDDCYNNIGDIIKGIFIKEGNEYNNQLNERKDAALTKYNEEIAKIENRNRHVSETIDKLKNTKSLLDLDQDIIKDLKSVPCAYKAMYYLDSAIDIEERVKNNKKRVWEWAELYKIEIKSDKGNELVDLNAFKEILKNSKITNSCEKPTPLGVGWIALYLKNNSK